jgi:hypothetical protein
MKRIILALLASAVALMPAAAPASIYAVTVKNTSTNCAWITVYWSHALTTWHINTYAEGRPRALAPGETYRFPLDKKDQMKVRAEIFEGSHCGGRQINDIEARRDSRDYSHEEPRVELRGDYRGYGLNWV